MRPILRRILTSRITYIAFAIVVAVPLLWAAVRHDYGCDVTGFGACDPAIGDPRPEKTLWDWLDLLIVPAVLAIVGLVFTRQERANERAIAEQRTADERAIADQRFQDDTLRTYLDQMTELLLDKGLRTSEPGAEVRDVARVRTLIVLRRLGRDRRNIVMQFLRDSKLVGLEDSQKIVNFDHADLNNAELTGIDLSRISLNGADLSGANLSNAELYKANLQGANFQEANLRGASLRGANLQETSFGGADLQRAILRTTDIRGVDFLYANLGNAILPGANLSQANFGHANLDGANLENANLQDANLNAASLKGTNLFGATVKGAFLAKANFSQATVSDEQLNAARSLDFATLPNGKKYQPQE